MLEELEELEVEVEALEEELDPVDAVVVLQGFCPG